MSHLVIYHHHCFDGLGAAWMARESLGSEVLFHAATYGSEPPLDIIHDTTEVFILDFSYPLEQMEKIISAAKDVVVLDHHKTAKETLEPLIEKYHPHKAFIEFDMDRSGAGMACDYFFSGQGRSLYPLIDYIEDRDLWKFAFPETKAIMAYVASKDQTVESYAEINQMLLEGKDSKIAEIGTALMQSHTKYCKDIIAAAKMPITINGQKGLVVNAPPMFASEIGDILATESGTFGAVWYEDKDNKVKFSLRSNGDYDVSAIAKAFGGGGHKNAAGFTVFEPEHADKDPGISLWNVEVKEGDL